MGGIQALRDWCGSRRFGRFWGQEKSPPLELLITHPGGAVLREEEALDSPQVAVLRRGETVLLLLENGRRAQVRARGNKYGWISTVTAEGAHVVQRLQPRFLDGSPVSGEEREEKWRLVRVRADGLEATPDNLRSSEFGLAPIHDWRPKQMPVVRPARQQQASAKPPPEVPKLAPPKGPESQLRFTPKLTVQRRVSFEDEHEDLLQMDTESSKGVPDLVELFSERAPEPSDIGTMLASLSARSREPQTGPHEGEADEGATDSQQEGKHARETLPSRGDAAPQRIPGASRMATKVEQDIFDTFDLLESTIEDELRAEEAQAQGYSQQWLADLSKPTDLDVEDSDEEAASGRAEKSLGQAKASSAEEVLEHLVTSVAAGLESEKLAPTVKAEPSQAAATVLSDSGAEPVGDEVPPVVDALKDLEDRIEQTLTNSAENEQDWLATVAIQPVEDADTLEPEPASGDALPTAAGDATDAPGPDVEKPELSSTTAADAEVEGLAVQEQEPDASPSEAIQELLKAVAEEANQAPSASASGDGKSPEIEASAPDH